MIFFGVEDDGVALAQIQHAVRRHALPALRRAVRLRRALPRPPGPLSLRALRRAAPAPQVAALDMRLDGVRGSRFELGIGRRAHEVALPLPGLYNVYNALAAAALATGAGRRPASRSSPACEATRGGVRPRGDA